MRNICILGVWYNIPIDKDQVVSPVANKAYKVRLYPNTAQTVLLNKTFGDCRFIYNKMLSIQQERHRQGLSHLSKYDAFTYMKAHLKSQYLWLREVDSLALMNAVFHLDNAYQRFFRKEERFPRFKSKHSGLQSYTTNNQKGNIAVTDRGIKLPKLGIVKAKLSRSISSDWGLKSATVLRDPDGKYYASLLYQYGANIQPVEINPENVIGMDYKSDGLYVDSNGYKADMPHYYRQSQKRLARVQRRLSRKQGARKGESKSNRYRKQQHRVANLHRHVSNQRKDFLHKQSAAIAKQYDAVCVEDLNMKAMSNRGFHNGKAMLDNGYGLFLGMLEYKLQDQGKRLVQVSRWYPSSQLCSCCGFKNPAIKDLRIRKWTCPQCGAEHDRDYNAAINIRAEGLWLLAA